MINGRFWVERFRYYSSVSAIYALTLLFAFTALYHPVQAKNKVILARSVQLNQLASTSHVTVISGRPIRLVIPASSIDLPVDAGYYDPANSSWTLSGYHAQFAMISTLANNVAGDTFIYGHNNNYVFGALRHVTPALGAEAIVYTDNGHIIQYGFQKTFSLAPDDTSVLTYAGPSIMTIQTCTGSVNEWRTMYRFNFIKVVQ